MLGAANFHVGAEYRLRMPVTAWYTAKNELVEGTGVAVESEQSDTIESLLSGRDLTMQGAMEALG